jgi:putative ABC transport system ATP-binding protein
MAAVSLIAVEGAGVEFDSGRIVALRKVDLAIERGESVAIVGPSGSGKTTLIHLLSGIKSPSQGLVRWCGTPVRRASDWTTLRRSKIGIVFQDFNLFPTLNASENIELALFGSGAHEAQRRRDAAAALDAVGLSARATHLPHELSGGERQRVAIARSIINKPALVLADEPTGNLDSANSRAIMDLLFELQRNQGTTLVLVTHEHDHALRCARQVELRDGRIDCKAGCGAPL